ncbi:hypothetical protein ACWPKO_24985 (plasmid) [Coraliomargarita sp. W4R53]
MRIRQLVSTETNRALFATPARQLLIGAITLGWILLVSFGFGMLPLWWAWAVATIALIVGEMFLGSYWADKDLLRRTKQEDSL